MKNKLTKLEQLFEESDYGVSSATGALSKMLRGFWKDIGLTHLHVNQLIDKWLEDPSNEFEQDPTKINNSRGNIRKDKEKDDSTWKVFLRNLRIMRPQEVRFLIRLKFKNGSSYRQVATMRPRSTNQFNSDAVIKDVKWTFVDDDGFTHEAASNFDDEGHRIGEDGFIPRAICVFKETEEGKWYCSQEDLIKFVNVSKDVEHKVINTKLAYDSIIDHVQDSWKHDMADHLRRLANADLNHPIIIYKDIVADGFHRIIRGHLMGIENLDVTYIESLPELKLIPAKYSGDWI